MISRKLLTFFKILLTVLPFTFGSIYIILRYNVAFVPSSLANANLLLLLGTPSNFPKINKLVVFSVPVLLENNIANLDSTKKKRKLR